MQEHVEILKCSSTRKGKEKQQRNLEEETNKTHTESEGRLSCSSSVIPEEILCPHSPSSPLSILPPTSPVISCEISNSNEQLSFLFEFPNPNDDEESFSAFLKR